jgi:hypothetical protein
MEKIMKIFTRTLIVSASLVLPFAAFAQSNDAAYCSALIAKYQAYLGSSGSGKHSGLDQDATAKLAIDQCRAGDTKSGIPVLEGRLKDAKIELPARS